MKIDEMCDKVIAENKQSVDAYKKGGPYMGFLVSTVVYAGRKIGENYDPHSVQRILRKKING